MAKPPPWRQRNIPSNFAKKEIEKHKSGNGDKTIFKWLSISLSPVKSVSKKSKACDTAVNLPRTGRPQKLSDRTRRRLLRENTRRPVTTLKVFKASHAQIGETAYNNTSPVVALWDSGKEKAIVKMTSQLHFKEGMWETLKSAGRTFNGLMRANWAFWPSDQTLCLM